MGEPCNDKDEEEDEDDKRARLCDEPLDADDDVVGGRTIAVYDAVGNDALIGTSSPIPSGS